MLLVVISVFLLLLVGLFLISAGGTLLGLGTLAKDRSQRSAGRKVARQLAGLGNLVGRQRSEFDSLLGKPASSISKGEGKIAIVWAWPGYAIALLFEGESCQGVLYEQLDH